MAMAVIKAALLLIGSASALVAHSQSAHLSRSRPAFAPGRSCLSASADADGEAGDRELAAAMAALQEADLPSARAAASRAQELYASASAETRASREALCSQVLQRIASAEGEAAEAIERSRAAAASAARPSSQQRSATITSGDGDRLFQQAVGALAQKEYAQARALVDEARAAFRASGASIARDREPALSNFFASVLVEEERDVKLAKLAEARAKEQEAQAAKQGARLVAELRMEDEFD